MSPRVTIHIPTYNQAQYLGHALAGALNQTYDDYQVIVSNNHSTDATAEILARYVQNPRLKVVSPPEFLPAVEHFKFCVAQSDSEYFSYLCSDDGLLPDFLRQQVALLDRHPGVAFAHCAAQMIGRSGELLYLEKSLRKTHVMPGRKALERFAYNARCVGDSVLFRRAMFDAVGGFGDLYVLDWEIAFLLCTVGDVAYNENVLMQYRLWDAPERTNPNRIKLLQSVNQFYDTYEPRFPTLRTTFARARRHRALGAIDGMAEMSPEQRTAMRAEVTRLSDDPLVRAKLLAFDAGLGQAFSALRRLRLRSRNLVKGVLRPLLLSRGNER